ncbi:MAG: HAD family hydrolase [Paracoccaceae bacterium]
MYLATLVAHGKPSPDIFLYAAKQRATAPECCLVVEDSVAGAISARAAGMRCLGFVGGGHCGPDLPDRLRQAGALHVMDGICELLNWAY